MRLTHGQAAVYLVQSGQIGMSFLKEKWTEAEVLTLPEGEHGFFDRKSGKLLANPHAFQEAFAKALSALANSGGGHIVFGQEDDGQVRVFRPARPALRTRQSQHLVRPQQTLGRFSYGSGSRKLSVRGRVFHDLHWKTSTVEFCREMVLRHDNLFHRLSFRHHRTIPVCRSW